MLRIILLVALSFSFPAYSQPYPVKPIRIIVTYPAGGGADAMARLVAPKLSEALGQPVLVENRGGASGTIAAEQVAKSSPDGYTLMLDATNHAVNPSLYPKLPYDPERAFAPVTLLALFPNMLVVHPNFPAASVSDLIKKIKAEPGKIAFASSGNGSAQHLAGELFRQRAGLDMVHVPYKGGGPALIDVMAGNSQFIIGTLVQNLPHMRSGKLRGIGIASKKRSAAAPEMPTIDESGLPGYEAANWWGIMLPAKTPQAIVNRLDKELAAILASEEIRKRFAADGAEPDHVSQREFAQFVAVETAKWGKVVKAAGIKPQ